MLLHVRVSSVCEPQSRGAQRNLGHGLLSLADACSLAHAKVGRAWAWLDGIVDWCRVAALAPIKRRTCAARRVASALVQIEPTGVTPRRSTDLVAIKDPVISDAVRFIQANALKGIHVSDMLRAFFISRTLLEAGFKRHLYRPPYEMIQQIRMKQVDALLRASNLTIAEIAERLGFHTAEYFSTAYKKRQGMSPSAYRAKMVSQLGCVDHAGPLEGSFWVVLDFFDKAFDQFVASHAWSDFTDDLRGNCWIVGL